MIRAGLLALLLLAGCETDYGPNEPDACGRNLGTPLTDLPCHAPPIPTQTAAIDAGLAEDAGDAGDAGDACTDDAGDLDAGEEGGCSR